MPYKSLKQKKEYNQEWVKRNRNKVFKYQRKYQLDYYYRNKEKILEKQKQRNLANPEKRYLTNRKSDLRKYGLTLEQYDKLEKMQKGKCAICRSTELNKKLAIDHCHKTGKVRGLLCSNCNNGLGKFKDSKKLLVKALKYLYES